MSVHARYRRLTPEDAAITEWAAPDGWPHRRFDWPSPGGRGRMLFQGGRGDVLEKYFETFAHFHARGWSITSFDWRGQGGSGRLSPDRHVGHADDFALFVADLAAIWRELTEGGGAPVVAIGHSMGGHLILRAMVEGAIAPAAAVLVAPMLGLRSPFGAAWGGRIAGWMARRGDPARPAWRGNERPASIVSRQRLLTSDLDRYADEGWWYDQRPDIRLGPPSWAWLTEAFRSTTALEADPRLLRTETPTLLLVAERDGLVDARAAVRIAAHLPGSQLELFGHGSAHEILREADPVRDRALRLIDGFLDRMAAAP